MQCREHGKHWEVILQIDQAILVLENILPAWKVFLFSFLRKKENQAVTLQCFGITEYACNFYNSAQTSLPHLVDITGRDIWGNKPWAGM